MGEAGVEADDDARAGEHRGGVAHAQERRHVRAAAGGDAPGQRLLGRAAPEQHRRHAARLGIGDQRAPVFLGPELLGAAGAGDEGGVAGRRLPLRHGGAQPEVGRRGRRRVAERRRGEAPAALDGVQLADARDGDAPAVEQARQRLARAAPGVAGARPARLHRPHRALHQPLQVDHAVVALGAQLGAQRADGAPGGGLAEAPAPLAPGERASPGARRRAAPGWRRTAPRPASRRRRRDGRARCRWPRAARAPRRPSTWS